MILLVTELLMRLGFAILLSSQIGFVDICLESPIAWVAATILLITSHIRHMDKLDLLGMVN